VAHAAVRPTSFLTSDTDRLGVSEISEILEISEISETLSGLSGDHEVAADALIFGVGFVGVLLAVCSARRLQLLQRENLVVGGDDESDEDVMELTQYPAHSRSRSRHSPGGDGRRYSREVVEVVGGQRRHGRGVHVRV